MIHTEMQDSIAIVRMEHGKVNAIDFELFEYLKHALTDIQNSDAQALVLTGTGKAFSAGVDLFRLLKSGTDYAEAFVKVLCEGLEALFFFPKPVIAAVNGHAVAGGCILACACDYRIGAKDSLTIGVPELLVGVPIPAIALEIVRFAAAHKYFQQIVYSGKTYSSAEALEVGLLDEVVPPENLLECAMQSAKRFTALPPVAFEITKRRLRETVRERIRQLPDEEQQVMDEWCSPETHQRIRAYLDRTIGKRNS
jgi:enoyl-CoA hydratase